MKDYEYCDGVWHVNGFTHVCLKRMGHDGACYCCDGEFSDNDSAGDLSVLLREVTP